MIKYIIFVVLLSFIWACTDQSIPNDERTVNFELCNASNQNLSLLSFKNNFLIDSIFLEDASCLNRTQIGTSNTYFGFDNVDSLLVFWDSSKVDYFVCFENIENGNIGCDKQNNPLIGSNYLEIDKFERYRYQLTTDDYDRAIPMESLL